jgi:hypothetical protein
MGNRLNRSVSLMEGPRYFSPFSAGIAARRSRFSRAYRQMGSGSGRIGLSWAFVNMSATAGA